MKVLIVDDDLALSDVIAFTMQRAGFEVLLAHDGLAALERWQSDRPDLILLDLNMPKLDGLQVCQRIRAQDTTPIIILSVRGEEDDIVRGLELGADDYIVKPFSPRQLTARAEAVLRRAKIGPTVPGRLTAGDLELDRSRNLLFREGEIVARLTRLEASLLETLIINAGQVLTYSQLIHSVWGPQGADRTMLKQLVYRVRRKIEPVPSEPRYLQTVPGIGYSLSA